MISRRFLPPLIALTFAPFMVSCGSLVKLPGGEPASHYMLRPAAAPNIETPLPVVVMIAEPDASAALDTNRVALKPTALELQYYADARWVDRAPRLLQNQLIAALSGTVKDAGGETMTLAADYRVQSTLLSYEAVYNGKGAPTIQVALEGKLFARTPLTLISRRTFTSDVKAASDKQAAIMEAFDRATANVTADFVDWVLAGMKTKAAE